MTPKSPKSDQPLLDEPPQPRDPIAAVTSADPGAYYAALARREGLWFDDVLKLHVASSPQSVAAVLAHPALLVRPPAEPVPRHLVGTAAGDLFGALVRMNEGEHHAAMKRVLADALAAAPAHQAVVADEARRVAATYAAELGLADGETRAIDAWVHYTPATIVARQVGFAGDAAAVARDAGAFAAGFAPPAGTDADRRRIEHATAASAALLRAGERLVTAPPPDSLAARIVPAAARAGVEPKRVAANLAGLVSQTFEATAGLLGIALLALARIGAADAARVRSMRDDPRLLDWVADVSRAEPSTHNTRRFAASDADVLGTKLPAGATVLVVLAASHHEFGVTPAARHACPGRDSALEVVCHSLRALLQSGFDVASLPRDVRYRALPNVRLPIFFSDPREG